MDIRAERDVQSADTQTATQVGSPTGCRCVPDGVIRRGLRSSRDDSDTIIAVGG